MTYWCYDQFFKVQLNKDEWSIFAERSATLRQLLGLTGALRDAARLEDELLGRVAHWRARGPPARIRRWTSSASGDRRTRFAAVRRHAGRSGGLLRSNRPAQGFLRRRSCERARKGHSLPQRAQGSPVRPCGHRACHPGPKDRATKTALCSYSRGGRPAAARFPCPPHSAPVAQELHLLVPASRDRLSRPDCPVPPLPSVAPAVRA